MKFISTSSLNTCHLRLGNYDRRRINYNLNSSRKSLFFRMLLVLFFISFNVTKIFAQNTTLPDSVFSLQSVSGVTRNLFGGTITNSGYGGPVIKFSRFSNQFAFMTGGRGLFTINNRYTLGGSGYGIANSIILTDSGTDTDTTLYYKMGYGGLELGYIIFPGRKLNLGGTLLVAAGAELFESKSKTNSRKSFDNDLKILPVLEPSFYGELQLNRYMRLHTGISYRFVNSSDPDNICIRNMSGFSCYMGLLFGKS